MRVRTPILLVALALGVLLLGALVVVQRGNAGADNSDECVSSSSSAGMATPAASTADQPPTDGVLVGTGLAVWAGAGTVRLAHTIVIQLPASSPQVEVLLGEPGTDEYQDALLSLLDPKEHTPRGPWDDFEEVGPFAEPSAIAGIMTSVPRMHIADGTATVVLPLAGRSVQGYPDQDGEQIGPWHIGKDGRDLVLTSEIDDAYGIPASTTWQVEVCAAGLRYVGVSPVPTTSNGATQVTWTLPFAENNQPDKLEVRLRPNTGLALHLWLFAGDRRYLSTAWSFLAPPVLLLVALATVPHAAPYWSALTHARRHLQMVTLASLGMALTGVLWLALIPLRSSISNAAGDELSRSGFALLGAVIATALTLLFLGRSAVSTGPRSTGTASVVLHQVLRLPRVFNGPILNRRGLKRLFLEIAVLMRQVARGLHRHAPLIPGATMLLAMVWWLGHGWLATQGWTRQYLGFPMIETDWNARFWTLARLLAVASCISVLAAAIRIGWPSPDRGAARWMGVLIFGAVGFALCTPLWDWPMGLIPIWTVGGFLVAVVVIIATFTLAPPGRSIVAGHATAWAVGIPLALGAMLAIGTVLWNWSEGRIPDWRAIGFLVTIAIVTAIALTAATQRQWRRTPAGFTDQRSQMIGTAVAGGVILAVAGILAQWVRATYSNVDLRSRLQLESAPGTVASDWYDTTLKGAFLDFPLEFISPAIDVLLLVGLAGIAGVLRGVAADTEPSLFWSSEEAWIRWLVVLSFAALVVGYGGEALGYRLPLAFLIALLLMHLAFRSPISTAQAENGAPVQLPLTAFSTSQATHVTNRALQTQAMRDDMPLGWGPRVSWWENGTIALRYGAYLAILPVAYFMYVLITDQVDEVLAANVPFAAMALLTGIAYEVAFWLTAAFALGSLYPFLWGNWGALKGAVLTAAYAGSQAVAAVLLGNAANDLWEVRSFQLLLFLGLLGTWLDYETLRAKNIPLRALPDLYHIGKLKIAVGYLSPLIATVVVIVRQLYLGETSDALNQVVTVFSEQIVSLP